MTRYGAAPLLNDVRKVKFCKVAPRFTFRGDTGSTAGHQDDHPPCRVSLLYSLLSLFQGGVVPASGCTSPCSANMGSVTQ